MLLTQTQALSGQIYIDGQLHQVTPSASLAVLNPATLEEIGYIADCREREIELAVASGITAQALWKEVPAQERGRMLRECGQILNAHQEELAHLMSYETGKALRTESRVELQALSDIFSFYGGLALELKGETIPYHPKILAYTVREPIGLVAAIIPWNVPLMLMATKIVPALVAGNTVILKPSPEATFAVMRAVELMHSVLPKGILNVITGSAETGRLLVRHPKIQKVSFTGSVESGRSVYQNAAEKIIPATLELGGKSPLIICQDADLDAAVQCAFDGMRFTRQGQSCSAASRLLLHEDIHDEFIKKLLALLKTKKIGDPLDESTDIGTLISKRQFDKVLHYIELARQDPSLTIHQVHDLPRKSPFDKGLFIRPTLISGIKNDHPICQEEIFGPLAAILKWSRLEEALEMANDTTFGLAAGIWTRDLGVALQATKRLDAGFVQVNQYMVFRPSLPFGGFKNSGLGKEASLDTMLQHYTKEKTILISMEH